MNILIFLIIFFILFEYLIYNLNKKLYLETFFVEPIKIDKTYVINLDYDKQRFNIIKEQCLKNNLNITRFNAINGKLINLNDIEIKKRFGNEPLKNEIIKNKFLQRNQIGCALSHINLWKKIVEENNNIILVLEDDAIVPNDFQKKLLDYTNQLPDNWDMLICGGNKFQGKIYSTNLIKPIKNKYGNYGTFGYIIKKDTAKKLLKNCEFMTKSIDYHLNLNFYEQNNVFFCNPQLIKHNYEFFSNIMKKTRSEHNKKGNIIKIIT